MSDVENASPAASRGRRIRSVIAALLVAAVIAATFVGVSVTSGDRGASTGAGTPDVVALAGPLADQALNWEPCEFGDDGQPIPGADISNVECATIQVPRDWNDPDPDVTWDVRISQARNIDPSDPDYNTTVIAHPGGPYASGLSYSSAIQLWTPELRETTNYVSFDQRGLGQSSRAECDYEYDPADSPATQVQAIGEACSKDADVATMTTEQAAYDIDFIRHLLELDSVTYMGYSYGTWLGTWYGSLFSQNIERMILDSATDSTQTSIQHNYDTAHVARDRQFRLHMLNWIARNDSTFGLGSDPEAIWNRYFTATSSPEQSLAAVHAWTSTNVVLAFSDDSVYEVAGRLVSIIIGESEAPTGPADATATATRIIDRLPLADEARAAAHARLAERTAVPESSPPGMISATYSEVIDFTRCTDGQWTQGVDYWQEFNERAASVAPLSAQFGLLSVPPTCAFWPTDSRMPALDDSFPETIVLQSELDSMTPWESGSAAGTNLPNTTLIAVDNENKHGVFPYGTDEVDGPVIDFLSGGDRPERTIVADATPMPLEESTFESWSPLDESAEHEGSEPQFTDPKVPADSAEPSE